MYRIRTLVTGVAGAPWYVNTYWKSDSGFSSQDSATRMQQFWTAIKGTLGSSLTYKVDSAVAIVDAADGSVSGVDTVTTTATVGSGPPPLLPPASQVNIRLATGSYVRGRQVLGHLYVPGLTNGTGQLNNTGGLGTSPLANYDIAAATLIAPSATVQMVVWSRPTLTPFPPLPVFGTEHPVTAAQTQSKFAVLRSRRD